MKCIPVCSASPFRHKNFLTPHYFFSHTSQSLIRCTPTHAPRYFIYLPSNLQHLLIYQKNTRNIQNTNKSQLVPTKFTYIASNRNHYLSTSIMSITWFTLSTKYRLFRISTRIDHWPQLLHTCFSSTSSTLYIYLFLSKNLYSIIASISDSS